MVTSGMASTVLGPMRDSKIDVDPLCCVISVRPGHPDPRRSARCLLSHLIPDGATRRRHHALQHEDHRSAVPRHGRADDGRSVQGRPGGVQEGGSAGLGQQESSRPSEGAILSTTKLQKNIMFAVPRLIALLPAFFCSGCFVCMTTVLVHRGRRDLVEVNRSLGWVQNLVRGHQTSWCSNSNIVPMVQTKNWVT